MKIVFMGTSVFAVPILEALLKSKHDIVAVYTKMPSKQARGMKLQLSPIHAMAEKNNIRVITPKTLRTEEAFEEFKSLSADATIVAAYGLIIPQNYLDSGKYGCINVHPSDLPRWRGAAPIQRTLMACDKNTAICIMKMDAGIDTGPVILKKKLEVDQNKDIHRLTQDYAEMGGKMLLDVLIALENGTATFFAQNDIGATYANKISPEEEKIDWSKSANKILGQIRALIPNTYFIDNDIRIKVIEAGEISNEKTECAAGTTIIDKNLQVVCGDGKTIIIKQLQKPGGKKLAARDFLCGYKLPRKLEHL